MSKYFYSYYVFVRKHTAVYICAPHVLPKSESIYICINNVSFNLKSRKCCKVYIQCTHAPFKGHNKSSSSWYNNSNTRLPLCMPKKVPFTLHAELLYTLWQLSAFLCKRLYHHKSISTNDDYKDENHMFLLYIIFYLFLNFL